MAEQSGTMRKSQSSGTLRKSGELAITGGAGTAEGLPAGPAIPKHLGTGSLTRRRKLSKSTGNLHGYLAEAYTQVNWPLPKMFGKEKYGYSLIDIEDGRHVHNCAGMSKQLIRLQYDFQIIDLEWRKTYKALLDAEHRQATLPKEGAQKARDALQKEVSSAMKYLLELQEQKDLYETQIQDINAKCDDIKAGLKKESDLEDLRQTMEANTKEKIHGESPFWRTKFNIRSQAKGVA